MVKNENHPGTSHTPDNSGPKPSPGHPTEGSGSPQSSGADEFNSMSGPALPSGVSEGVPSAIFEVLRVAPPRGVCVLHPDQQVHISGAKGLCFDVDDTLLVGSGKHAHDGVGGRFHGGVSAARREAGLPPIDDKTWEEDFETLAGGKESQVILKMALRAGVEPERVEFHTSRVLDERIHEMLARVPLATGALELLISARDQGLLRGILSASSERFVARALENHGVLHHFDARVCSAEKKIDQGVFSGNPFQQICRELGIDPRDVIMIGDSIADYATHRLGVKSVAAHAPSGNNPVSIMIVQNHHENRGKLDGAMREVEKFHHSHDVGNDNGTLLVISSFTQVRVGPPSGELCWQVF